MRFVVDAHRGVEGLENNPALPRHCESLERGLALMSSYTEKACKVSPKLRLAYRLSTGDLKGARPKRSAKPTKAVFPTTRFSCVMVNPVAQIWVCTKEPWEGGNIGRRSEGGKAPAQDKLPHRLGEFAVLTGDDPVLDEAGVPKVFTRMKAEETMQRLFDETPPENHIADNNDPEQRTTTVYQNQTHSVHFDPDFNGATNPFNIYNTRVQRPVLHPRGDFLLKFRSITGAIKEADRLDKVTRGV